MLSHIASVDDGCGGCRREEDGQVVGSAQPDPWLTRDSNPRLLISRKGIVTKPTWENRVVGRGAQTTCILGRTSKPAKMQEEKKVTANGLIARSERASELKAMVRSTIGKQKRLGGTRREEEEKGNKIWSDDEEKQ